MRLRATLGIGLLALLGWSLGAIGTGCGGSSPAPDAGLDADADAGFDGGDQTPPDGDDAGTDGADEGPVELQLSAVLPSRGPIAGGTWTNIVGGGFVRGIGESPFDVRDVTDVWFGDNSAIDIEVVRDDMISVRTPPGLAGPAEVVVENPNGRVRLVGGFMYYDSVTLASVDPRDLADRGGTPLTVHGTGFTPDTMVLIGDRPASGLTLSGATELQAFSPPGTAGAADLQVVNRNGSSLLYRWMTFHPAPNPERIEPAAGDAAGGTPAVLSGRGFETGQQVLLGAAAGTEVQARSAVELEFVTPAGLPGAVDVSVVGPVDSGLLPGGFVWLGPPLGGLALTAVAPSTGPATGGQQVVVVGEGLAEVTEVWFADAPAADIQPLGDRMLQATVPSGSPGAVAVRVVTPSDEASSEDAYRYFEPLVLDSVTPDSGPLTGGTVLALQGAGFHDGIEVRLGGRPATGLQVESATRATAIGPPGPAGEVAVEIRDTDSNAELPQGFTYLADLSLTRIEPDSGAQAGGTYVTLFGSGFGPDMRIWFGDREGSLVQLGSGSILTARSPRGEPGEVTVVLERGSARCELPNGFSYFDPTNDRGGASGGPIRGSFHVTTLDGTYTKYGNPLPGATVLLQEPALSGTTDDRGQVTFSGPSLVRAVTVTVGKPGFEAMTLSNLNAANLTIYLYPNEQEPIQTQPGNPKLSGISGRVFGFKDIPGLPVGPTIQYQALVNFTAYSLYSVPPYGGIPRGVPVETDGGSFDYTVRFGTYSLYALFGALDTETEEFTPALLGVRRSIVAASEQPVTGQDIVLTTPLDHSLVVRHLDPPLGRDGLEATYGAYASLDLGREGIVYLSQSTGPSAEVVLDRLPAAAAEAFLFVGLASLGGGYPFSYTFRRQEGDLSGGVDLGPYLGFTQIVDPPMEGQLHDGLIRWTVEGPEPALTQLLIETSDLFPVVLWRVVVPGDVHEVRLPPEMLGLLPQGEQLLLLMYTADSPRFDFDRFNYGQLSSSRWTNYTINFAAFTAP